MAEVRKRTTKPALSDDGSKAPVQSSQPPTGSNNVLYLLVAGAAAAAVYYVGFTGTSKSDVGTTPASPLLSSSLTSPSLSSAAASKAPSSSEPSTSIPATGELQLTDAELSAFTGEDPDSPIYVALNGSIFDVSSGRGFYGPGGHYGHFSGRDATRAWVTTCFDKEFWTYDLKGAEQMFLPKWLDEEMEDAAAGKHVAGVGSGLQDQAQAVIQKIGKVSTKEKARRREEDAEEAKKGIEDAMKHWLNFFRSNPKYKEVGIVVGREPLAEDRKDIGLCEDAIKKRPIKGGRLGDLNQQAEAIAQQKKKEAQGPPDFVKKGQV